MGFLNNIGKKGAETTTRIAKEGKLRLKINENKSKIKDLYQEIGKKVYEKHIREEDINLKEYLQNELANLDDLSKEIENARMEILRLNQKKLCNNCFEQIPKNAVFCPKCGEKQAEVETIKKEALETIKEVEIAEENQEKAERIEQELEEEVKKENTEN